MYPYKQLGVVLLVTQILSVVLCGFFSQGEDNPAQIEQECVRYNCTDPLCYIPHPSNCLKFIMCRPTQTAVLAQVEIAWLQQVMPCAFGTRWKQQRQNGACERHDLAPCMNEPCQNFSLTSFKHRDSNCRTYWRCETGRSVPACCPQYQRYDPLTSRCVEDIKCKILCPLVNDASCRFPGIKSVNFPDNNCKTYWDCEVGHVCCPDGEGYDVIASTCAPDASCMDACPTKYKAKEEICKNDTVSSHVLDDKNCRTYTQCTNTGPEFSCCKPGDMFDNITKTCVAAKGGPDCANAKCPPGYKDACRLEAVPGKPTKFKFLDGFGGTIMSCAIPTVFDPAACQCVPPLGPPPKVQPGCTIAIHALPPALKNNGTAVAALQMIGSFGHGGRAVGNMSTFWDGDDGILIPFYGSQWLRQFYLEVRLQPISASGMKQIILSSCEYRDGATGRVPTLELSVTRQGNQSGIFQLQARSSDLTSTAVIETPYTTNSEYVYRVIYDSKHIGVFVDTVPAKNTVNDRQQFSGLIPIHLSGLRFGHCRYEENISSFVGYISEIKFSKCVTPEMTAELYPPTP